MRGINNFVDLCVSRSETKPEKVIFSYLVDGESQEEKLTYRRLDQRARAIAAELLKKHLPGERVLLLYPPGLEYILGFLGCLYAGLIAVPIFPPDPARLAKTLPRLLGVVKDCRAVAALSTADVKSMLPFLLEQAPELASLDWMASDEVDDEGAAEWRRPEVDGDTLAFLQYTSGSTGHPKGVMVSHGNLVSNERLSCHAFQHDDSFKAFGWLPLYHDMGLIGNVLHPLYVDFPMILMSPLHFLSDPLSWMRGVSKYRVDTSGGPNFAYDLCARKAEEAGPLDLDLSNWTLAFCGAEPIRAETIDRFVKAFSPYGFRRESFYPCYGLAEATLIVSGGKRGHAPKILPVDAEALQENRIESGSCPDGSSQLIGSGEELPDHKIRIVDSEKKIALSEKEVGEIWFRGPSVALGYWQNEAATQETFRAYLQDGTGPFLRTGDLGFMSEGQLYVTGRAKDLIIVRGRNYYPQDIEFTSARAWSGFRPGCTAAFSVVVQGEEKLVVVQEVDRRHRARRSSESNVLPLQERRSSDRRLESLVDGADPEARGQFQPEEAVRALRRAVAEEHDLEVFEVVLIKPGTISKTSSGKIQRRACLEAYRSGRLEIIAANRHGEDTFAEEVPRLDRATLEAAAPADRLGLARAYLQKYLASLLRVPSAKIDMDAPILEMGLDSLKAVEFKVCIQNTFGKNLTLESLTDGLSLNSLAQETVREFEEPNPEELLNRLDDMPEDQIDALLERYAGQRRS